MQDSALVWSKVSSIARRGNYHRLNPLLHATSAILVYFRNWRNPVFCCIKNNFHHTSVVLSSKSRLPKGKRDFNHDLPFVKCIIWPYACVCHDKWWHVFIFCKNERTHKFPMKNYQNPFANKKKIHVTLNWNRKESTFSAKTIVKVYVWSIDSISVKFRLFI